MTAWTNFPWELKNKEETSLFCVKEHLTLSPFHMESIEPFWSVILKLNGENDCVISHNVFFFTKYWKAKTEYDRTPGRSCFIFFCHSHNNGVLMTLRGFETIPHQRPRGSPRHKMGHFLEWLKVWGLHLLIFENSVTSFVLRLNVFESHGTSKASAPQLLHCELCLIAWHVVTRKG